MKQEHGSPNEKEGKSERGEERGGEGKRKGSGERRERRGRGEGEEEEEEEFDKNDKMGRYKYESSLFIFWKDWLLLCNKVFLQVE